MTQGDTVGPVYSRVDFCENSHNTHPITCPCGQVMGCVLWAFWRKYHICFICHHWYVITLLYHIILKCCGQIWLYMEMKNVLMPQILSHPFQICYISCVPPHVHIYIYNLKVTNIMSTQITNCKFIELLYLFFLRFSSLAVNFSVPLSSWSRECPHCWALGRRKPEFNVALLPYVPIWHAYSYPSMNY